MARAGRALTKAEISLLSPTIMLAAAPRNSRETPQTKHAKRDPICEMDRSST
jgi:hypothetical protein